MKKNLIIVGANGYLGKGIAGYFIKKNSLKLYLCDRNNIEYIRESKDINIIKIGDLAKEEAVRELFSQITFHEDEKYFLYSTIGGFSSGKIEDLEYDNFVKIFELNFFSQFLIAKHFSKNCANTQGGSLCFTSAYTALTPEKEKGAYGTSKAALNYFAGVLANEGINKNLTVNVIVPYALDTSDNKVWIENEANLISPSKIAETAEFLFESHPEVNGRLVKMPENIA